VLWRAPRLLLLLPSSVTCCHQQRGCVTEILPLHQQCCYGLGAFRRAGHQRTLKCSCSHTISRKRHRGRGSPGGPVAAASWLAMGNSGPPPPPGRPPPGTGPDPPLLTGGCICCACKGGCWCCCGGGSDCGGGSEPGGCIGVDCCGGVKPGGGMPGGKPKGGRGGMPYPGGGIP